MFGVRITKSPSPHASHFWISGRYNLDDEFYYFSTSAPTFPFGSIESSYEGLHKFIFDQNCKPFTAELFEYNPGGQPKVSMDINHAEQMVVESDGEE